MPTLARYYPRSFTFYVARPARSIPGFLIDLIRFLCRRDRERDRARAVSTTARCRDRGR